MGEAKTLKIASKDIVVKELTVKEVEEVIDACVDGKAVSTIDLLFDDIPSIAVMKSSGLTLDELMEMRPSEIRTIVDAVKEVNPFFVSMQERLRGLAKGLLEARESSETSEGQSAG